MKLCIIGDPNIVHVRRWLRYFSTRHDVYFFGLRPTEVSLPENVVIFDLTSITNVQKIKYLVWAGVLRHRIKNIKPDVVHAHWISGAGWIGASSGFHPLQVTVHGSDLMVLPNKSRLAKLLAKWVLRKSDYITCVSQRIFEEAMNLGVDVDKLELIRLGIDTSVFKPAADPDEVRHKLGLDDNPIVASIRAMTPLYNPLDIAHAIPLILDRIPDVRFIVQTYKSSPELLSQFETIVRDGGAAESVQYVAELADDSEIAQIYQVSDVAISVASSDGTPISVQEAMACGCAMVLGDIPAFQNWVTNGKEAVLIPLNDVEQLAASVVSLLEDPNRRKQLSSIAQEYVNENADSRYWMRRADEIYHMLADI
jgi:glycosyltransferase involved in cell wall biosynthesis